MISIIIPTYNEESIIEDSLQQVRRHIQRIGVPYEIIVADNGSTDKTRALVRGISNKNPEVRLLEIELRGPGRAFQAAARAAKFEYLISLDADLSSEMVFIEYSLELLKFSSMVVGSKTFGQQKRKLFRILGSQAFILATQIALQVTIADFSLGAKAYVRSKVLPHLDKLDPWTGYVLELAILMTREGAKVVQIGVDCNDTRKGHFNLFYEALYRFNHLFHLWRRTRQLQKREAA
jgi:glycosyltransferase involved in cell wall biosynthesis